MALNSTFCNKNVPDVNNKNTCNLSCLNLVSYNMHGFNQGANTLDSFCKNDCLNMDIIFIQEHWLSPGNMSKITNFSANYVSYGISAMESAVGQSILRGRPYGGTSILVKSNLSKNIYFSKCNERFVCIALGEYLLFNCYVPKITNDSDFALVQSLFSEIEGIIALFPTSKLVLGGDLNVDLSINSSASHFFRDVMNNLSLISCHNLLPCSIDYTYCHESLQYYSYIDYILVSKSMCNAVTKFNILDLAKNLSDHSPITISLNIDLSSLTGAHAQQSSHTPKATVHGQAANHHCLR